MKPIPFARQKSARIDTRRGSTLIIVVALLGMLAFLGFVFYTFAKQEKQNAVSFAKGAQVLKAPSLEPDSLFDFALQQIILGPPDAYTQSILWGGRHSLLANMFGRDGVPWNGEGVNLIQDPSGQPHVDMNFNGTYKDPNDNPLLINFVDSPAANSGTWSSGTADAVWGHQGSTNFKIFRGTGNTNTNLNFYIPEPDVNYNSPNIDSIFLSYDGIALDATANTTNSRRVIIPSFLRPQYLRLAGTVPLEDVNRNGILDTSNPNEDSNGNGQLDDWYQSPAFANQVMRPHPNHVCVDGNGNPIFADSNGKNVLARYINSIRYYTLKSSGVSLRRPFTSLAVNDGSTPGTFAPPESSLPITITDPSRTLNSSTTPGSLGVWSSTAGASHNAVSVGALDIDLDVDTDGDGVMDAILMDLGFPPVRRGDGKLVVPLFAISIRDLNGLLNVNATGNLSGNLNLTGPAGLGAINSGTLPPAVPPTQLGFRQTGGTYSGNKWTGLVSTPDNLSKSNLGLSTYEINIQRALTANPDRNAANLDNSLLGSEAATQLSYFLQQFDSSINTYTLSQPGRSITELANLEWWLLNIGRAGFQLGLAPSATNLSGAINSVYAGRMGDPTRLWNFASSQVLTDMPKPGLSTIWAGGTPTNWPLGANSTLPNPDDNNNVNEGEAIFNTRWGTPLDFRGSGQAFQRYTFGPDGKPGVANQDDDANGVIDDISEEGWSNSDDVPAYGKYPEFAHYSPNPAGTSAIYSLNYKAGGKPITPWLSWPAYQGYHSFNGSSGGVRWGDQQTTGYYQWLMSGSHSDSLLDDPAEAIIDPVLMSPSYQNFVNYLYKLTQDSSSSNPIPPGYLPPSPLLGLTSTATASYSNSISNDAVFGPEEMLFLQGSSADGRLTDSRSRLADLMPGNLVASQNAPSIRKRLTTVSQDRREFGLGVADVGGVTTSGGTSTSGGLRSWEVLTSGFPPSLTNGTANPYRQELYSFLQQSNTSGVVSQKLNVNRWLYLDGATQTQYGFAPLPEQTSPSDANAAMARQQMARDIYTLLYTFCSVQTNGTSGDVDYRNLTTAPTAAQTKEMAQFAVNLVDALDADNIVTAFYYDTDLSQNGHGWQTTSTSTQDYIYGIDGIAGNADDNVVYGVERQLLTFSEAAAFIVKKANPDSKFTIFDDSQTSASGRPYIFFELQNVSPIPVALASSSNITTANATTMADWRVRMVSPTDETKTYSTLYFLPGLTVSSGATPSNFLSQDPTGGANPVLLPGAVFSVASQDGTDTAMGAARTSDFRADTSLTGSSFPLAVPTASNIAGGLTDTPITPSTKTTDMVPRCNLDLVWSYPDNNKRFLVTTGTNDTAAPTPGAFAAQLAQLAAANPNNTVRLILERRAAAGPDVPNNIVWAPVDKTSSTGTGAGAGPAPGATSDVVIGSIDPSDANTLKNSKSYPRSLPLLSATTSTNTTLDKNTINAASNTVANSNLNSVAWQLHTDRDFGSLSELLLLPLYGSDNLTAALANVVDANSGNISTSEFYEASGKYYPTIAAARFLHPENPDYTKNGTTPNYGNRWYRLFDFLEVPNRSHQHPAIVGTPPSGGILNKGAATNYGVPITFNNPGMPGVTSYYPTGYPTTATQGGNPPDGPFPTTMMFTAPFGYPQYFGWPNTHGLLNLNMIRDPQVLAALIDDDQVIQDPRINLTGNAGPYLDSADPSDTNRKWWFEFLKSRDSRYVAPANGTAYAVDPVAGFFDPIANKFVPLYVPGTANSRPFRSTDTVGPQAVNIVAGANLDSQLENTIFRSLPMDSGAITNSINESRRLFEVGSNTDHIPQIDNEASGNPLHPSARFRLMSKLLNNTTTRSNSFAVYITVQYYEAVQVSGFVGTGQNATATTAVQIGGRLDDAPTHRGFFIVDRTGAIEQMKILATNNGGTFSGVSSNSYSFNANTDKTGLRVNLNGIRWKDLVLYRQTMN
ncbi:MAG: hypothetical protein WCH39_02605 [Schlesneria sp.]